MEKILADFELPSHPDLLVGFGTRDDAGVFKIGEDTALIQTVDFFTPMVDDPYIFGQVAATNALNDVYAMGGKPLLAMNIVCFPQCADIYILKEILRGGLDKIKEAGALLVGGHTVDDNEPKYGLAVTGIVHPHRIIGNAGAKAGDVLFLTKPLGNGVIATAIKAEMASKEAYEEAVFWMTMLNKEACSAMQEVGVNAATDITGFGLIGHLYEMASASDVNVEIYAEKIGFMKETLDHARIGLIPGGAYTNREYLKDKVEIDARVDAVVADLLFSPETAGGLLLAVPEDRREKMAWALKSRGCTFFEIGKVTGTGYERIRILP
ncbi:selenophosphate synthase [Thermosyntropha lipolytica DSM 11003]|uniref:Selenide, water dikinase n=1 Tax=Thermosyntropha lipolytica DSM 11003 TaxID=1123382 RepID=A0A1M5R5W2_9FIRM|nr:selenophosphate synthase [Thermosyntropha lipolytica DSM 11003]